MEEDNDTTQINTVLKRQAENFPNRSKCQHSEADIERMVKVAADRKRQELAAQLWRTSGVRLRHREQPPANSAAWDRKLVELVGKLNSGFIIALIGARGCGKSQMAVELVRESCRMGAAATYTTAMDIFIELRDAYKLQESERAVLALFQRPALLIIDEVQERGESAWEDRLLAAIIDYRYSMLRDTVLISNQTRAAFEQSIGTSVISRMVETGGIVECNWKSFRG